MKAFLVGLIFLCAVMVAAGISMLLFPLVILLSIVLRILVAAALLIVAVWLLGKFIIWVWERMFVDEKKRKRRKYP